MQLSNINWSEVKANAKHHAKKRSAKSDLNALAKYLSIDVNDAERAVEMAQQWTIEQITEQIRENIKRAALVDFCLKLADDDQASFYISDRLGSNNNAILYHELIVSEENPIDPISLITRTPEAAVEKILHANIEICLSSVGIELRQISDQQEAQFEEPKSNQFEQASDDNLSDLFSEPLQDTGSQNLTPKSTIERVKGQRKDLEPLIPDNQDQNKPRQSSRLEDIDDSADNISLSQRYNRSNLNHQESDKEYREEVFGKGFSTEGNVIKAKPFSLRNFAIIALTAVLALLLMLPMISDQTLSSILQTESDEVSDVSPNVEANYQAGTDVEVEGEGAEVNDRVDELGRDNLAFKTEAKQIRRELNEEIYKNNPDLAPKEVKTYAHEEIIKMELEQVLFIPSKSWHDSSL